MKVLVISDTHFSNRFDQELFDYIVNLVKKADKVIINGDFWDGYLISFDTFLQSKWSKLFPLLKKKNTVYVTGNHDKYKFMDERVSQISDTVVNSFTLNLGKKRFHFQHGHHIAPTHDKYRLFHNPLYLRFVYGIFAHWYLRIDRYIKIYATYEHIKSRHQLQLFRKFVKFEKAKNSNLKNDYYIFGHSHLHRFYKDEKVISVGPLQKTKRFYMHINNGKIQAFPKF